MKKLLALLLCCASLSALANGRCLPPNKVDGPDCQPPKQEVVVLMYHRITTADPPSSMVTSPRMFNAHLDAIKSAGYNTITVSDLGAYMRGERLLPPRAIVLTFDDGWRDAASAASNLSDRGMVGTFFLISNAFTDPNYVNKDEARQIAQKHEIGAHTHTHFMEFFPSKMDQIDDRIMLGEIAMSKAIIEGVIGKPVTSFAWPFSYYRDRLNTIVSGMGLTSVVQVNSDSANTLGQDPMSIHRLTVNGGCTPAQLLSMIEQRKYMECK